MQNISLVVFTILICSVFSLDEYHGQDKKLFHAFLEEIYGNGYQIESFVDLMWPKIQEVVPASVRLPAVEIINISNDEYTCATETTAEMKVGKILNKKVLIRSKEKITFEVVADLILDARPVQFAVAQKLAGDVTPTVPVSYVFKGPNRVKFVLEINNFLGQKNILTPQCLIKVKNVLVVELSEPGPMFEITDVSLKKVEQEYWWNIINQEEAKVLMTVGLVNAVNNRFNANTNFWTCPSKFFSNVVEGYKGEWEYTENYFKYCLKKENPKIIAKTGRY